MFRRLYSWIHAAFVARRFVKNWPALLLLSVLRKRGVFYLRGGGFVWIDARTLLKSLVRGYDAWKKDDDALPLVRYCDGYFELEYFGSNFRIPLNFFIRKTLRSPASFYKEYDVDVVDCVVLDIGAFIGDSVLYWLKRGAREVIAVEPVPEHYELLLSNVKDKPVTAINAAVGVGVPYLPEYVWSGSYGISRVDSVEEAEMLDVPTVRLLELVEKYRPQVVKIDCEGCEHFCLEDLVRLPGLGVKTLIIEIHDLKNRKKEELLRFLQSNLGSSYRITAKGSNITIIYNF